MAGIFAPFNPVGAVAVPLLAVRRLRSIRYSSEGISVHILTLPSAVVMSASVVLPMSCCSVPTHACCRVAARMLACARVGPSRLHSFRFAFHERSIHVNIRLYTVYMCVAIVLTKSWLSTPFHFVSPRASIMLTIGQVGVSSIRVEFSLLFK
jgi:hypothetical protein